MRIFNDTYGYSNLISKAGKRLMMTTAMTAVGLISVSNVANAQAATGPWDLNQDEGSFTKDFTTPNTNIITQLTDRAIGSGDANIDLNETVVIRQNNSGSLFVARDTKTDPTQILGNLRSNGRVMVIDDNGVFFGSDAVVNVGSIIATTASISNADIMDGNSTFEFTSGAKRVVENKGTITVAEGGLAAFVAPTVKNSGVINAVMGTVAMASGQTVTLDMYGDGLVEVAVDGELAKGLIKHTGRIDANGGNVIVSAKVAKDAVDNVINMNGVVNVASATVKGGKIVLSGGSKGTVRVNKDLTASGTGQEAGSIEVTGQNVLIEGSADLLANSAGANAGDVIVRADDTLTVNGSISAQGLVDTGFVETSAPNTVFGSGASILATREWLLDPTNILIDAALAALLSTQLDTGDMTVQTNAGGAGAGNIELQNGVSIVKTSGVDTTFTVNAHNDIKVNGTISATGAGALNVNLNADFDVSGGNADVFVRNDITTNGGSFTATASDDIDIKNGATVSTNGGDVSIVSRGLGDGSWLWMPTGGAGTGAISTNGGNVDVRVDNINLANGSTIDAGTGEVIISRDVVGTIGLGAAAADMELTQAELSRIDADALTIGGANTAGIDVDSVDTTTTTIADLLQLNALGAGGDVTFNGSNTFNALGAEANDDIHVTGGSSITTLTGGVSLTANNTVNDGVTVLEIDGTVDTSAAGAGGDVDLAATGYFVEVDSTGKILTDGGKLTVTSDYGFDIDNGAMVMLGNGDAHIDAPRVQLGDDIDTMGLITGTASSVAVENDDAQIQDGVDVAANNATITVAAGTYAESVNVNKTLTLLGNNNSISGGDAGRLAETIVTPSSPGFYVTADNVTIDGFEIVGADNGVLVDGADNAVIKNNIIRNATVNGISFIADSDDGLIDNNKVTGSLTGIRVTGGSNRADITNNVVEGSGFNGIVAGSLTEKIAYNIVSNSGNDGISVLNSAGVKVKKNTVTDSDDDGISVLDSDGALVRGNTVDGAGNNGINIDGSAAAQIIANTVNNTDDDGIDLDGSTEALIENNKIGLLGGVNNIGDDGIDLDGSGNATIKNNNIQNVVENGIDNRDSHGTDIIDNTIRFVGVHGIYINPSDNIRILDNTITDTGEDGIHSEEGNDIRVRRNTIRRTGDDGVDITRNDYVRVTDNTVTDTNKRGISIVRSRNEVENFSVAVADNTVRRTGRTSIVVDRFTTARVVDNIVTDSNRAGIRVQRGDEALIRRNTIRDTRRDSIKAVNLDQVDIRRNLIRRAGWDGIRLEDFDNGWIAYNDIKWTGDDGIDVHDGEYVGIYDNYIDLAGFLPAEFFGNEEVGEDANGIHVYNVGGGDLPPLVEAAAAEGYGTSQYGYTVEIYGNDVANAQDDGIQVEGMEAAPLAAAVAAEEDDAGYTTYIADNIVGHVGDDGIDVDDVDYTKVSSNAITLAEDKGITIDGGNYAGVFDNRVLLTGGDGIQVENVRYDHDSDITLLGDDSYGYGWAVNVSGNEVAMAGDDGIEVRNSDATKVQKNKVFMAGMGKSLYGMIETINDFANETFNLILAFAPQSVPSYEGFEWSWGDGSGINVQGIDGAYYSPNGWAADIRGNRVKYTGGHGILAKDNDRTRIKNNRVRYAGIDETSFGGAFSMLEVLSSGPFDSEGRRDLWMSTDDSMIAVLENYFGAEEPEYDTDYITIDYIGYDAYDGIHAENIYGQSLDGLSGNNYLYDLKIKNNDVRRTGDDGIEVVYAGRTLIADNTVRHSGYGDNRDYGSGDYYGADGIHARYISGSVYGYSNSSGLSDSDDGYDYEPAENYALIIRNNDVRNTADDGIEVVGEGAFPSPWSVGVGGIGYPLPPPLFGTTDRVLIAENTIRRSGIVNGFGFYEENLGPDGYGADGIHVRGINGQSGPIWPVMAVGQGPISGESEGYGYYGYAVDVIDNDVRRTGDDGVEVINSTSTLILGNTVRRAGVGGGLYYGGGDYYGADGIHVRNVGDLFGGPIWSPGVAGPSGIGFKPYSVVITENDVRRTADDGIEVVDDDFGPKMLNGWGDGGDGGDGAPIYDRTTGRTLVSLNDVRHAGYGQPTGSVGDGFPALTGDGDGFSYGSAPDGYGADGIHVRGVGRQFYGGDGDGCGTPTVGLIGNGFDTSDFDVEILDNYVWDTADDGVEVRGRSFAQTNILVDGNMFEESGDNGILIASGGSFFGPEMLISGPSPVFLFDPVGEVNSVVSNNTVIDSGSNGLHISGSGHNDVEVSGNTFTDNDTGALFESGEIDLTGAGNIFNGGRVGMRFAPAEMYYRFRVAPSAVPISPVFADMSLVGNTIGAQVFNGQSGNYVELDNGAFFNPGTPTLLNALDSTYVGTPFGTFTPSVNYPAGFPVDVVAYLESKFLHFNDDGSLGLFFFPLLPGINQEDIFNYFGPNAGALSGLNVTILGLPTIPGGAPVALNNIAPAAGGGTSPEALNAIATAAGGDGQGASCWGDAANAAGSGQTVNLSYGGSAEELLSGEASCGS